MHTRYLFLLASRRPIHLVLEDDLGWVQMVWKIALPEHDSNPRSAACRSRALTTPPPPPTHTRPTTSFQVFLSLTYTLLDILKLYSDNNNNNNNKSYNDNNNNNNRLKQTVLRNFHLKIYAWMENITNVYKDRASLFNVTNSYEGRPLMGIKVRK